MIISNKELKNNNVDQEYVKYTYGCLPISEFDICVGESSETLVNKYHFSIVAEFKNDYDVSQIEEIINLKPYKIISTKKSKTDEKHSVFWLRTKDICKPFENKEFENFINKQSESLQSLSEIAEKNNGKCYVSIVFSEVKTRPALCISDKTLKKLGNLKINFDIHL